ncbi:MAG: hypothetical protein IK093_13565, partial [Ruminiclostridium sp.]|nr:hypothetical protein [Ruminiclostridium sp.]
MKKTIKFIVAIVLSAAMVLGIASCGGGSGVDMNKIKGDWNVSTICGLSTSEFASAIGYPEVFVQKQYNFTDKEVSIKTVTTDGYSVTSTGSVAVKADGVEGNIAGTVIGFKLNADNTLSYSVTDGVTQYDYVLKKGTYDLEGQYIVLTGIAVEGTKSTSDVPANTLSGAVSDSKSGAVSNEATAKVGKGKSGNGGDNGSNGGNGGKSGNNAGKKKVKKPVKNAAGAVLYYVEEYIDEDDLEAALLAGAILDEL